MATTYLTLTNSVLRELNETELTSSTFSSSRGIQTAVKDFINKGIHDIYNETGEIPLFTKSLTAVCIPLLEENVLDVNSVSLSSLKTLFVRAR